MLYNIFKLPARLAFHVYCRNIHVGDKRIFSDSGPLLIACNHPNSFLDAILLSTFFKKPVYSLARGDVFINRSVAYLLKQLNILPVYRISEGAHRLTENYSTFASCREIFRKNGIVLIFSEGLCVNEWHLRELKKGTARLAIQCWEEGIPLRVLPLGINYQSFTSFGKNIILRPGPVIRRQDIDLTSGQGAALLEFNRKLKGELEKLVIEIPDRDPEKIKSRFDIRIPEWQRWLLAVPSAAGWILHAPLYLPFRAFVKKKAGHTGHFDSIMIGGLFFLYPAYVALITACVYGTACNPLFLTLPAVFPFLAWCHVRLKSQY